MDLLIAFGSVWLIPGLAFLIANLLRPALDAVDPSRCFASISAHHLAQLALTIVMIKVVFAEPLREWGFNLANWRLSMKVFGWFCVIYLVPVFLVNALPGLRSGAPPRFAWPLTPRNIAGTLGFQFLLSGTCEEPLFRGFVMTLLNRSWKHEVRFGKMVLPISALWATLFFMLAHVSITLAPFAVRASLKQEVWTLALGLYYAAVFARTRSLLAPILSHGYSNGVIFLILYVLAWAIK